MNLRVFSVPVLLAIGLLGLLTSGLFVVDLYITGLSVHTMPESNVTFIESAPIGGGGGGSSGSSPTPPHSSIGGSSGSGSSGGGGGSSGGGGGGGSSGGTDEDLGGITSGNPGGSGNPGNQTNTTDPNSGTNQTNNQTNNQPNLPPRALLHASHLSGIAPLTVLFDAIGSSDPNGDALSYRWTFANGTLLSTSISFSYTFTGAGNFVVNLLVSDNRSASSSNQTTIGVSAPPQPDPECSNDLDDDSDGLIDMDDPGCSSPSDTSEFNSVQSSGTVYYVCNTGGSDSNSGTSPNTPWASFAKAKSQFTSLAAGQSILFCEGGSFTATESSSAAWRNTNCTPTNPCTLGSYTPASGVTTKPLIRSTFAGSDGSNAIITLQNTHRGYVISNLHFRNDASTNNAIWILGNGVSYITMDGLIVDGFTTQGIIAQQGPTNIILRNSLIQNVRGRQGFFGGGNNYLIENNTFLNNGGVQGDHDHNLYVASGAAGVPFRNLTIRNNYLRGSASTTGRCVGVEIVVHGHATDVLIEGNVIDDTGIANDGCWGIAVGTGYDEDDESFTRTVIRGNTVINSGNTGILVDSCPHCIIENNVVIGTEAGGMQGIVLNDGSDVVNQNVTVRHNSVILTRDDSVGVDVSVASGSTNRIYGNAIYYKGNSGAFECFSSSPSSSAYSVFDYNNCFGPSIASPFWMNGQSLAAWRTASGKDTNSFVGNPLFTSLTGSPNLLPLANSPLINKVPVSLAPPTDIRGIARPSGPLADIGAYEL